MRFHDLRHSFASLQLAQGTASRVLMEQLGHSDIRLTLNLYSHVLSNLQTEAAIRLDELLAHNSDAADLAPVATSVATQSIG
jgi:integrase